MKIGKDMVVSIHYTLTGTDGEILDSSSEGAPLSYLHGAGNIIPGLESALEGKGKGDHVSATIAPEQGYGARIADLVQTVPRSMFAELDAIEVGGQFVAETGTGELLLTITAIKGDTVTVDGNHPLAGATLHFEVDVDAVRDATPGEIEDGHPEGAEGEEGGCDSGSCGGGCSCG
jgi:FKBP-type peptidyl-prolyl cis-trans isomerase SlyD